MFIGDVKQKFRFSPDEGGGGSPATEQADSGSDIGTEESIESKFLVDVRNQAKADFDSVFSPKIGMDQPKPDHLALPNGDRRLDPEITGETPLAAEIAKKQDEQEKSEESPDPEKTPEAPEKSNQSPGVVKIHGQDFALADLEKIVPAFYEYHQKAQQFDQAAQKINADFQALKAAKNAPEALLVERLKSNPELRARVIQIAEEMESGTASDFKHSEASQEIEKLRSEIAEMKKQQESERESFSQAQAEREQRAQAEQFNQVTARVDQFAGNLAKELGVPDRFVDDVRDKAILALQNKKMNFSEAELQKHFDTHLREIAGILGNQKAGVKREYLERKQNAPAPPPTGGSPMNPRVKPKATKFGHDLDDEVTAFMKASGVFQ